MKLAALVRAAFDAKLEKLICKVVESWADCFSLVRLFDVRFLQGRRYSFAIAIIRSHHIRLQ